MSKERTCIFCGKTYQYCPNCRDFSSYPQWMVNFDTDKCHDLYNVIAGYNVGIRKIEDVKAVLDKYNVTDYSIFTKDLQEKLFNDSSEKKEEVKIESNDKPKEEIKEETADELEEEAKEEVDDKPKEEVKVEPVQKKKEFTKGNNNFVPRKMKKK